MKLPIYLDYQATTPCDPRVVEAMLPYFTEDFGNSSSVSHVYGQRALKAINKAQEHVANLIGADDPKSIFFTSGATESNNIALKGVMFGQTKPGHLVTTATEHKAVLDPADFVSSKGHEVTCLPVNEYGQVEPAKVETTIKKNTRLVSVIFANNEVGSTNDVDSVAAICRERGVLFHTDATQAVGRVPMDCKKAGIDMLSLSGHKLYGPKGIGALYIRRRTRGIKLEPLQHGGGHQNRVRSGTLPVPLIVGLGEASRIAEEEFEKESKRIHEMHEFVVSCLTKEIGARLNGDPHLRITSNVHLLIPGINSEALVHLLRETVAFSTGAACTTASPEPSHVLQAMGISPKEIASCVRIGIGRFTSRDDLNEACKLIINATRSLQGLAVSGVN